MVTNFLLRLRSALEARGKSRSAHYLDIQRGLCTKPVRISARAVAWPQQEIEALIAAQIAGKSDDELRTLVKSLEAARKGQA
jgi:prophage regulatory protein